MRLKLCEPQELGQRQAKANSEADTKAEPEAVIIVMTPRMSMRPMSRLRSRTRL